MFARLSRERTKLIGCIMIALSGCSTLQPQKHLTVSRAPSSLLDGAVSREVILLGDTQLHEFYGAPVFLGSLPADYASKVAIRSAPQRLFGSEILKRILNWNKQDEKLPIIHMGDAVDVSCMTEWRRFTKLMQNARPGVEWVLVPGNHDGYFEGVLYPRKEQVGDDWAKDGAWRDDRYGNLNWDLRCDAERDLMVKPGGPSAEDRNEVRKTNLRKRQFVCEYLKYLKLIDVKESACTEELNAERTGDVRKDEGHFLRRVAWRLAQPQWQSFLLQVVDMSATDPNCGGTQCPRTWGILLDTSQYEDNPRFSWLTVGHKIFWWTDDTTAGERGEIRDDQARRAKELLREMKNSFPGSRFVIFGHHDFESLTKKSKKFIAELIREGAEPLYVSAHTHKGFWKTHDGFGYKPLLVELNVGSLLDAPVHFRDFQLKIMNQKTLVHSEARLFDQTTATPHESWNLTACPPLPKYGDEKSEDERVQLTKWAKGSVFKGRGYNGRREVQIMNLRAELLEYEALLTAFPSSTNVDEDRKQLKEIRCLLGRKSGEGLDCRPENHKRLYYQRPLRNLGTYDENRKPADSEGAGMYKACLAVEAANYDTDLVPENTEDLECAKQREVELGTGRVPGCK